jgi:hypothetical protein
VKVWIRSIASDRLINGVSPTMPFSSIDTCSNEIEKIEGDGGQRGCATGLTNQILALSNVEKSDVEKIEEIDATSNPIKGVAPRLNLHLTTITGPAVRELRMRFQLTAHDAIEATNEAQLLAHQGV